MEIVSLNNERIRDLSELLDNALVKINSDFVTFKKQEYITFKEQQYVDSLLIEIIRLESEQEKLLALIKRAEKVLTR